jgi:hypothetical protein
MRKLFITIIATMAMFLGSWSDGSWAAHSYPNSPHWFKTLSVPYNGTGQRAQIPVVPYLDNNAQHDYWVYQATLEWMNWGAGSTPHNIQPIYTGNRGGSLECSDPSNPYGCPAANGQIRVYDYEGGSAGGWGTFQYQYYCVPGTSCTPDLTTTHIIYGWMALRTDAANHQKQQSCHEMGHTLGLDHQSATDSCLMNDNYMFDGNPGNGECSQRGYWTGSCVVPNAHDDMQLHNNAAHTDPGYSRPSGVTYPSPASTTARKVRAQVSVSCASPAQSLVPTPALDKFLHLCVARPKVLNGGSLTRGEIHGLNSSYEVVLLPKDQGR